MDFVMGFPKMFHKNDDIWFILDRLIKTAHFISIRIDFPIPKLGKLYVREVMKLHGVPSSIVSNKDPRFTSWFWVIL